jgi:hypothetical protein
MAVKVEIIYEAEATSLKATVNEVNKANDAVEASVKQTSKEISNSMKEVGKSFVNAFAGTEVKKSLADNNKAFEDLNKKSVPLTRVLRGLKNELNALEEAGKGGTAQFKQLEIEAARLEDQIGDTRARVRILASDTFKFDAAVGAIQGLASGFELAQGAAALFGEENEDLQKALTKITAATAVANGVQQIAILLKEENATKTLIQTKAEAAYAAVVGTSTGALKAFRIALAATGIGLVIVAIGALIANFDKLKDAIFGTSDTTRALKATLEGVRTAQAEAIEQTSKVGTAFELARKGVISKDEALLTYNETLGDSFGKTNDLNVAEANYVKKKDAFIQATAARAQAQALLAQSAALAAEAATVTGEQATNFGEKIQTFIGDAFGVFNKLIGNTAAVTAASLKANTLIVEQNAKERVQTEKTAQAEILTNLAASKLAEAEVIENGAGIASEVEQKIRDQREEAAKKAAEAAKELAKAERQANIDRRNELAELQKGFDNQVAEQRKKDEKKLQVELTDLADTSLQTQLDTRLAFLRRLEIEEGTSLDRRINIIELEAQKRQDNIRNTVDDTSKANALIKLDEAETQQAIRDERKKSADEAIDQAFEIAEAVADTLNSIIELQGIQSQKRIEEINAANEAEKLAIEQSTLSEANKQRKLEALRIRTEQKVAAEKTRQAKAEKAAALFEAIIGTAAAIAKAGNPFLAVIAAAAGAAQIAIIAATPIPKFKKGGMVGGRSHEAGGTLIEAERGEYVVNKNSVMRNRRELDAINTSSAAFKRLIDERYVRPAILSYAMSNKRDGITVNASLNSKAMERKLDRLNKTMAGKQMIVNINGGDSRYTWQ